MNRKILLPVLALFFLLACTCSLPAVTLPATAMATAAALPIQPSRTPHAGAPGVTPVTVVRLFPQDGSLTEQLELEAPKAAALGQHMFVEFDASW